MPKTHQATENTPLRQPTYFILLSMASGAKHGYAILKDVERLSDSRLLLSTSTLYTALSRLQDQGLIKRISHENNNESAPGLPRKMYCLTNTGRKALVVEIERMQTLIKAARLRLGNEVI